MARDIRSTLKTTIPSHLSTNVTNSAVKARMGLHGKGGTHGPAWTEEMDPNINFPRGIGSTPIYPSFFGITPGSRIYEAMQINGQWIARRDVTTPGHWQGPSYIVDSPITGVTSYLVVAPNGFSGIVRANPASVGADGFIFIDMNSYPEPIDERQLIAALNALGYRQ